MRRIILAAAVALLPLVAGAQFYKPSAVNAAGVSRKPLTASRIVTAKGDATREFFSGEVLGSADIQVESSNPDNFFNAYVTGDGSMVDWSLNLGSRVIECEIPSKMNAAASSCWSMDTLHITAGELPGAGKTKGIAVSTAGVAIGLDGTPISKSYRVASTIDIASIAANICATDSTITVTGAVTGAECFVGSPATLNAGLIQTCFVSAADTVKLRTCNSTAGAIDPASATYSVRVFNP